MRIAYEKVPLAEGSSFALLDKHAAKFDGRFHFHPEFEITLIESSSGRRVVGDSIDVFTPGDLVLLGENLPHQYVTVATRTHAPAVAKVIQFRRDFVGGEIWKAPECAEIHALLEKANRGLVFSATTLAAARRHLAEVFATAGFERMLALLKLLRILAADRGAKPIASAGYQPRLSTRQGAMIDRALRCLNERFTQPLRFTDFCHDLNTTPATCNRLFRRSLGRSFRTVLIDLRISHACRLLLETDRSIVEIAYASGFANLSNFNRRFRQMKRTSPRLFRRLAQQRSSMD